MIAPAWDADRANAAIEKIAGDAQEAFDPGSFWPRSELDNYGRAAPTDLSAWIGAAGVLWALDRLGHGLGEAGIGALHDRRPDVPGSVGLMNGETGVQLVSWRLDPQRKTADRLFELVSGNRRNPSHELFDGSPGTMLAALHLYEATHEERWARLWRECAADLLDEFRRDPELGCPLWIQYRRGRLLRSIGAGHGFASNVRSLLRGEALLESERLSKLRRDATETALALAMRGPEGVNWPTAADRYWAESFAARVQWCHGAPGLVTSLASLPSGDELDTVLSAAGELVWRAGPLAKGAGLCHGTAGNGCAFLALHARTGEARWLERARAFAMQAIGQVERSAPRYSLWTGHVGVALYLRACIAGWEGMPFLDVL